MKFKSFQNPFHLFKWKKSCHLLSRVLYLKRIWIHGDQKAKMKVWDSPFIPSHLTSKSFEFTHFQSINQTINPIYLFIITFQNLEFWDVTLIRSPPVDSYSEYDPNDYSNLEESKADGLSCSPIKVPVLIWQGFIDCAYLAYVVLHFFYFVAPPYA